MAEAVRWTCASWDAELAEKKLALKSSELVQIDFSIVTDDESQYLLKCERANIQ